MEELIEDCFEGETRDSVEVIDLARFRGGFQLEDDTGALDMTSLGAIILLEQSALKDSLQDYTIADDDSGLQRLSMAYERLHFIPKLILEEWAPHVRILDISNNQFVDLRFLGEFKELTSLICDHNNITSKTRIPYLPKLELLWMNHCKISNFYPWVRMLQYSCPNLRFLSLMGNPISPYYNGGGDFFEYIQYRWFLITLFPNLTHLDEQFVTEEDRKQAQKIFQRPLIERLVSRTQQRLPENLRVYAEKVSDFLSSPPPIFLPESTHNAVI